MYCKTQVLLYPMTQFYIRVPACIGTGLTDWDVCSSLSNRWMTSSTHVTHGDMVTSSTRYHATEQYKLVWFILRPQVSPWWHDDGYIDGWSHFKVHTDERTQVHSARSSLVVTHPSTNRVLNFSERALVVTVSLHNTKCCDLRSSVVEISATTSSRSLTQRCSLLKTFFFCIAYESVS